MAELMWYAAYGSNLLEARFLTYLRGGPVPGAGRMQRGARDRSDPVDALPYRLDRRLAFCGRSRGWQGGGVCFVEPGRVTPGDTLGRAWLITVEQLADVWLQENGAAADVEPPTVDGAQLVESGSLDLGRGWYRKLELLGEIDGHPVATITCEALPDPNPAGPAYLGIVGRGLMETWAVEVAEAAHYLATRHGNVGAVEASDLVPLLASDLNQDPAARWGG